LFFATLLQKHCFTLGGNPASEDHRLALCTFVTNLGWFVQSNSAITDDSFQAVQNQFDTLGNI